MLFTLIYANEPITDKCEDVRCQNGSTCVIKNGKAFCTSADGYGSNFCKKCK